MLNNVTLMGRLTQDPELKSTPNGTSVLSFTIAVERDYAKPNEEREADFISCTAWGKTAEFISRYFLKGRMIAVVGSLRTRTFDDRYGTRHYVTEVNVDKTSFTGEKIMTGQKPAAPAADQGDSSVTEPSMPVNIADLEGYDVLNEGTAPF